MEISNPSSNKDAKITILFSLGLYRGGNYEF